MPYEAWRITYQSSEQAARAAHAALQSLGARITALEGELATLQAGLQAAAPNAPLYDPREVAFSAQAAPQAVHAAEPETREALAKRLIADVRVADTIATSACQRVAELPDRDSPADWPESMLVTGDELHMIVREAVIEAQSAPAYPAEGVPAPMPVAHPHHCTARTADGSCEECEGHAQAMAEWNTERAALAATQPAAQGLDLANCKGDKWLTVVYRDIQPGDESRTIVEHPKVSALSWSHALHDRDAALAAQAKQGGAA